MGFGLRFGYSTHVTNFLLLFYFFFFFSLIRFLIIILVMSTTIQRWSGWGFLGLFYNISFFS